MTRIFEPAAYGPQGACFWADTVPPSNWPQLDSDRTAEVAIIGGGFTGLNAALALAKAGVKVTVLEAEHPGWGASGRNGGFCCLGGSKATSAMLARRFGPEAPADWHATEKAAVAHVEGLIDRHSWDVDRHSRGETVLAHTARAFDALQRDTEASAKAYGVTPELLDKPQLRTQGLGGPWYGGLTLPIGFGLNPRKYHALLASAAAQAGAMLHAQTAVTDLACSGAGWRLTTAHGNVQARQVIIATNGYSHEDLPHWLRARSLPAQSSVIVTRPLSRAEQEAAGWWSDQMAYDTRFLLHYFRLMPDGRFLFGMRGGLNASPRAQRGISRRIRANFTRLFPAWQKVEITHEWSGLVCLMRSLTPFVGAVPGHDGLFAGLGFHGNGVAMGSYAGQLLADRILGRRPDGPAPDWLGAEPQRFPLGRYRRSLLAPAYFWAETFDL